MTPEPKVELQELTRGEVRNLSGHDRGLEARRRFGLDDLDSLSAVVEVVIPSNLLALTTSFFQGMFAESVHRFGGREQFLAHYKFNARPIIMRQIDRGIDAVLLHR